MTYKLIELNKKEIVQHRNNLLPYYPKEYALCELTHLYSFTRLKNVQNYSDHKQNQSIDLNSIQKPLDKNERELPKQTLRNVDNKKKTQPGRKKSKIRRKQSTTRSKRKIST